MSGEVWGRNTIVSADQVKSWPAEVLQQVVLMAIDQTEHEARTRGIDDPKVHVMFITEVYVPFEEDGSG